MEIIHVRSGQKIAGNVKIANTFFTRLKGLMFTPKLEGMDALLIDPCNSIHNFFVYFALDVVFIDSENRVVKVIRNFRPWRVSWIYFRARKVLELPSGKLLENIEEGDELEVRGV